MLKRGLDRQTEQRDPIWGRFVGASAPGTIRQLRRMKGIRIAIIDEIIVRDRSRLRMLRRYDVGITNRASAGAAPETCVVPPVQLKRLR